MPLTDEEDIFGDFDTAPADIAAGDDDNDTDYEDVSQAAAEDDSRHPDEVVKSVKVRDILLNPQSVMVMYS